MFVRGDKVRLKPGQNREGLDPDWVYTVEKVWLDAEEPDHSHVYLEGVKINSYTDVDWTYAKRFEKVGETLEEFQERVAEVFADSPDRLNRLGICHLAKKNRRVTFEIPLTHDEAKEFAEKIRKAFPEVTRGVGIRDV